MSRHPSDNNPGPEQEDSSAFAANANPPDRIRRIMDDPRFRRELRKTEQLEKDRVFCRHDWQHLLDTARIMQILCLRESLPVETDLIYAAALLHDI